MIRKIVWVILFLLYLLCFPTCGLKRDVAVTAEGKNIHIRFDEHLYTQVVAVLEGKPEPLGMFIPSEYVMISGKSVDAFAHRSSKVEPFQDDIGAGKQVIIVGETASLRKEVTVSLYDAFPNMAIFQCSYRNIGTTSVHVDSWVSNRTSILKGSGPDAALWSYQSGSYESRPDWILPLKPGFHQDNYMGMNASDYGGGTPVSDVWRRDAGVAVGHLETVPKLVSLPVAMPDSNEAVISVTFEVDQDLRPDESLLTLRTFVAVHRGDCFQSLSLYRTFMTAQGIPFDKPPETAYEPIWCAWGFGRNFTTSQIYAALPEVEKLGFKWAVLDDGWQTAEGDWYLVKDKFPGGARDMKALVDEIHSHGMKAQLWWAPMAVDPGTDLIHNHRDYLLLNQDGSTQDISWWDAYYLCPAYKKVLDYSRDQVLTIMKEWGYDGLKIDGQHLNMAPPCYNPAHHHLRPEESVEGIPKFFQRIYETALSVNPEAVVEICPCGTAYNFFTMPFMNQPVASDPESSWQIRLKGKVLKALMGPSTAYFGDHVELSDGGDDFASTVGVGGVIGTKFTWPVGAKNRSRIDLTPAREVIWKKWVRIYKDKMLPKGEYLGALYDLGFDRPETHAIKKQDRLYYAFYAGSYEGPVELRGLESRAYRVTDYVQDKDLAVVKGPVASMNVQFNHYLLIEALPVETDKP